MHVIRNGVSVCNRFFENIKNSSEQRTKDRRVRCPINPLSNPRHFSSAPPSAAEDKTKRMHLSPLGGMKELKKGINRKTHKDRPPETKSGGRIMIKANISS